MTVPASLVADVAFLLGALALSWGLTDLPGRVAARHSVTPKAPSQPGGPLPDWIRTGASLVLLALAVGLSAGGLAFALDRGSSGIWTVLGFVIGAIPSIGLGLASDLVFNSGCTEVADADIAGLRARSIARASAGGRTLAALSGGAAIVAFASLFVLSDSSLFALTAFMAGAVSIPILGRLASLGHAAARASPAPDRVQPGSALRAPRGNLPNSPLPEIARSSYELLAIGLASSTLFLRTYPVSWFLFSDAIEIPLLIASVGVWATLLGSLAAVGASPLSERGSLRTGVAVSIGIGLIGTTAATVGVGGSEPQLWAPVAMGAVMVELTSVWALAVAGTGLGGQGTGSVPARVHSPRRVRRVASTATAGIVAIVTLGSITAFAIAGEPTGASYGFDGQVGWLGIELAGMALVAWAATGAWVEGMALILRIGRSESRSTAPAGSGDPRPEPDGDDPWPGVLVRGYRVVASAMGGVLILFVVLLIAPERNGISPAHFLSTLTLGNPGLVYGVVLAMLVTWVVLSRAWHGLVGRSGQLGIGVAGLLSIAFLFGAIGLIGFTIGSIAGGIAWGGWSLVSSAFELGAIPEPAEGGGVPVDGGDGSARPAPSYADPLRHANVLALALPVVALFLVIVLVVRLGIVGP